MCDNGRRAENSKQEECISHEPAYENYDKIPVEIDDTSDHSNPGEEASVVNDVPNPKDKNVYLCHSDPPHRQLNITFVDGNLMHETHHTERNNKMKRLTSGIKPKKSFFSIDAASVSRVIGEGGGESTC